MGTLTLCITGAAGFIGRHVVAEARTRGFDVAALMRHAHQAPGAWAEDRGIHIVEGDLAQPSSPMINAIKGAEVTLHCATRMTGNDPLHAVDTATQALLDAMPPTAKLVHLSSIVVYDFAAIAPGETITEDSPLDRDGAGRDGYARAKIAQERLVRDRAAETGMAVTVLRPGAVYGPGRLDNAHLGRQLGPILFRFGHRGEIPLVQIKTMVEAALRAVEAPAQGPINVLDRDLPDRVRFLNARRGGPTLIVPLPAALLRPVMTQETRAARFGVFEYSNDQMHRALGLAADAPFETLMQEAQA